VGGVAVFLFAGRATAQYPNAAPAQPGATRQQQQFQKSGITVNRTQIFPGQDLATLFGVVGPPDHVDAVRGKEATDDYVRFTYRTYGFNAHVKSVNNRDNVVESIVILQNNVQLVNVPFKVGDDYRSVMQLWGQPDQQEPGFMAYWKRGVYVAVADNGQVAGITLAEPGHVDTSPTQRQGQG
jgi:hypothetical protein